MSIIECKNVALGYDGRKIVENLNFSIDSGDYLCIVGENGSGKSTLLKTLLRLKTPFSGEVITNCGGSIGYLPQQTPIQRDFPATVEEVVLSGCISSMKIKPFYGRKEKAKARDAMEKMRIVPLAKRCYRELSGGQQQRVLLARALCATNEILFLDEPVAGLDPIVTAEMYDLIAMLNKQEHITVVMISHDKEAIQYATHVLHVGRTIFFGTKNDYLNSVYGSMFSGRKING